VEAVLTLLFSWAARSFMIRRFRFTRLRRQIGPIPTCLFHASKTADASRNRSSPAVCKWHADCMPEGAELALQVLFYNLKTQFLTVHLSPPLLTPPHVSHNHVIPIRHPRPLASLASFFTSNLLSHLTRRQYTQAKRARLQNRRPTKTLPLPARLLPTLHPKPAYRRPRTRCTKQDPVSRRRPPRLRQRRCKSARPHKLPDRNHGSGS